VERQVFVLNRALHLRRELPEQVVQVHGLARKGDAALEPGDAHQHFYQPGDVGDLVFDLRRFLPAFVRVIGFVQHVEVSLHDRQWGSELMRGVLDEFGQDAHAFPLQRQFKRLPLGLLVFGDIQEHRSRAGNLPSGINLGQGSHHAGHDAPIACQKFPLFVREFACQGAPVVATLQQLAARGRRVEVGQRASQHLITAETQSTTE